MELAHTITQGSAVVLEQQLRGLESESSAGECGILLFVRTYDYILHYFNVIVTLLFLCVHLARCWTAIPSRKDVVG
jgi:hypothetical protein